MVVLSIPNSVDAFEGRISHTVVVGPSETLVFVAPESRNEHKNEIDEHLQLLISSLAPIQSTNDVNLGDAYIAKVNNILTRVVVIGQFNDDSFQVYMVDEGMKSEVTLDELFEFPMEMTKFSIFACICPVLLGSVEESISYNDFIGRKCRCTVADVGHSSVVIGFVKGRLLIDLNGTFTDITSVLLNDQSNTHNERQNPSEDEPAHETFNEKDATSSSSSENNPSKNTNATVTPIIMQSVGLESREADVAESEASKYADRNRNLHTFVHRDEHESITPTEYHQNKSGALFHQTAFKEFNPGRMPTKLRVRFEKKDRSVKTFWVVHPQTFSAVEKALRENVSTFTKYPHMRGEEDNSVSKSIPCIVYTRADSSHTTFFRGVVAHFDRKTIRFSVFLVDFGWFKWVLAKDVIDISSMSKTNPLMNLPVSLIHCREDNASPLRSKELIKGNNYEITMKSCGSANIFNVLVNDINSSPITSPSVPSLTYSQETMNKGVGVYKERDTLAECKKMVNETCHQQLMSSLMLETLTVARRELAAMQHTQQPQQSFWPRYNMNGYGGMMPMMVPSMSLPIAWPFFVPTAVANANSNNMLLSIANQHTNSPNLNLFNVSSSVQPYHHQQQATLEMSNSDHFVNRKNSNSFNNASSTFTTNRCCQQQKRDGKSGDWSSSGNNSHSFDKRHNLLGVDVAENEHRSGRGTDFDYRRSVAVGGQKQKAPYSDTQNESETSSDGPPSWSTCTRRSAGRRCGEGRENGSPESRMTAWERAVAEDRANRKCANGDTNKN